MKSVYSCIVTACMAAISIPAFAQVSEYEGSDPVGTLSYCLPSTVIRVEACAVCETFHAGPYAKYAAKYLGVEARTKDAVSYKLSEVSVTPLVEADQSSRYLLETGGKAVDATFLKLTSCGLVSVHDGDFGNRSIWRFPSVKGDGFEGKGLTSNVTSESAVLYHNVKKEASYDKVAVHQNIAVEKSPEKRAAETASLIFNLRKKRMQIITGDTDATYSGEAMGAAVEEIARLEQEYLTMFLGYSEYDVQKMSFDLVPQKDRNSQMYVAFRISDTAGLMPAENVSGKPIVMEVVPQEIVAAVPEKSGKASKKTPHAVYRVPAVCTVKLLDGVNVILQSRIPVHQLGFDSTYPLNVKTK